MTRDNCSVFLEQFRHLCLGKPHSLVFQSDINSSLSIVCLIYDDLVFHWCGGFFAANIQKSCAKL